ncbi:unnamed protein product [Sphagnum jensenii]|uniref:CCHC-type domain-containing protein n=1 Tax=Sphagnum jensenii TaxID=128206 RepID=A0ABP1BA58_9BRYO
MVKMKNHSELEDTQISKLNECFLVADGIRKAGRNLRQGFDKCKSKLNRNGGGARTSVPSSSGFSLFTNGLLSLVTPLVQSSLEAPPTQSFFLSGTTLGKERKKEIRTPEVPAAPKNPERCQAPIRTTLASSERSDGEAHEGSRQQSPLEITIADTPDQVTPGANETTNRPPPPQEARGAIAVLATIRIGASAENLKEPNEKAVRRTSRKNSSTLETAPPANPTLNVHSGSGSGRTSPLREEIQGPSPVDYSIELKANFLKEMVIEMQVNAARKARRTMIGRTLGGRASFKTLQESLKLHLSASFISTTLVTKGFFLILFEDEEGAKVTKKLATVEWGGLSLSFSRYNPNFDANAQGAKALLTHAIKVQFPDLHEQFRNKRALTIIASKLGEVLEIEVANSYIKRPAGPMVTIEVKDIIKFAGFIKIPSMAEGAAFTDTIRQKILYSGLSNQCRKCRRFGHQARACNIVKSSVQEGVAHRAPVP